MFKRVLEANAQAVKTGLTGVLLDASAAFESTQHDIAFQDLINEGVPGQIVKLLAWLYRNTRIKV